MSSHVTLTTTTIGECDISNYKDDRPAMSKGTFSEINLKRKVSSICTSWILPKNRKHSSAYITFFQIVLKFLKISFAKKSEFKLNCQFLNCHMELICAFQLYNLTLQHKSKNLHYFLQFHSKTNYLSCALLLKVKLLKRFNSIYFLALFCSIKVFKAYTWRCAIFKCVIFETHTW